MAYSQATKFLPPDIAGRIDLLRPWYPELWGAPINGQQRRGEIVHDLARAVSFDRAIESTYTGTSAEFFSTVLVPVATVVANPRFFAYGSRRLAVLPHVNVTLGNSRAFLQNIARLPGAADESVFIYLDAYWESDLPLAEELQIIGRAWIRAVVMIDDFQVPSDDGYGFDDYGKGRALNESCLPQNDLAGWHLATQQPIHRPGLGAVVASWFPQHYSPRSTRSLACGSLTLVMRWGADELDSFRCTKPRPNFAATVTSHVR